jgi:hypothetical protein
MKAFNESQRQQIAGAGLILLFDGEVGTALAEPRRAQANRYPDSELKPRSRLPSISASGLWEFVVRYSGATVPDSHRVS